MPQQMQEVPLQVPQVAQIQNDLGFKTPEQLAVERIDPAVQKAADAWFDQLTSCKTGDVEGQQKVRDSVEAAGAQVEETLARKSGLLNQQIRVLGQQAEGGSVAKSLVELKVKVDEINPNRFKLLEPGGIGRAFTWIPGVGTTVNRYMTRWQSAGSTIDSIVMHIREGSKELARDNDVLRSDQNEMRATILRLQKVVQTLMLVDKKLSAKIEMMEAGSEDRKFLEEEVLFYLRQRIGDLQQNMSVNQQGVMAYEFTIRTNRELMRGAKRCENITVRALEIAVVLAIALNKQRMELRSIQAVDETTASLMMANAEQLKTQGAEIFKMSANQSISIDTLKKVYADLDAAFESMAKFKQDALPQMAQRMLVMNELTTEAQKKIERMEKGNNARPVFEIDLDATGAINT